MQYFIRIEEGKQSGEFIGRVCNQEGKNGKVVFLPLGVFSLGQVYLAEIEKEEERWCRTSRLISRECWPKEVEKIIPLKIWPLRDEKGTVSGIRGSFSVEYCYADPRIKGKWLAGVEVKESDFEVSGFFCDSAGLTVYIKLPADSPYSFSEKITLEKETCFVDEEFDKQAREAREVHYSIAELLIRRKEEEERWRNALSDGAKDFLRVIDPDAQWRVVEWEQEIRLLSNHPAAGYWQFTEYEVKIRNVNLSENLGMKISQALKCLRDFMEQNDDLLSRAFFGPLERRYVFSVDDVRVELEIAWYDTSDSESPERTDITLYPIGKTLIRSFQNFLEKPDRRLAQMIRFRQLKKFRQENRRKKKEKKNKGDG